ncbi:MAG: polysaccharide deacetylase family protein [Patescibacteria group bacterium]
MLAIQGALVYGFYVREHWFSNLRLSYLTEVYLPTYDYALASGIFGDPKSLFPSYNVTYHFSPTLSVPVLLYHGVMEEADDENINISRFREHMFTLKSAGYETVSLEDFYDFLKGNKNLPTKSFLLTFDDGRKDSYYPVDPILKALNYEATIFIITNTLDLKKSSYYLSSREIEQMERSGRWTIGSHSVNGHGSIEIDNQGESAPFFSNLRWLSQPELISGGRLEESDEFTARITKDLIDSRKRLENLLDKPIISFAFPFGDFGERTVNFPEVAGIVIERARQIYSILFFQFATGKIYSQNYFYSQIYTGGSVGGSDEGTLVKRIGVDANWTGEKLLHVLETGAAKPLPHHDNFSTDRGWASTNWGVVEFFPSRLRLAARSEGSGSVAILDGSRLWKNYEVKADVVWPKGSNIYLWGRVQDSGNYAACNFGKSLVHVEQVVGGGKVKVIRGETHDNIFPEEGFEIGMRAHGRTIECLLNGEVLVATEFLDESLSEGGIGFKTWDAEFNNSELIIRDVSVQELL